MSVHSADGLIRLRIRTELSPFRVIMEIRANIY